MPASYSPNKTLIELHVPDFGPVKNYYTNLGFEIVWERRPDCFKGYLVLRLAGNVICFWAGNDKVYEHPTFKKYSPATPRGNGVEIIIMIDNIEGYYEKMRSVANVVEPLVRQPWGAQDFRTLDPYGYYLRFTELYNTLDPRYAIK